MAHDETFNQLWLENDDPVDHYADRLRGARLFFDKGAAAERARIRQMALDKADWIDESHPGDPDPEGAYSAASEALRDFAALLEKP